MLIFMFSFTQQTRFVRVRAMCCCRRHYISKNNKQALLVVVHLFVPTH